MNPHNSLRVYNIIQHLQSNDSFNLDWMDLHEMTEEDVLKHFDLAGLALTEHEKNEFIVEVTKQAQKYQTAEIVRGMFEA